ncbi:MAG: DUF4288 domain-containing protein [Bacteroidetes bacterium]|nr:DUF4288 domain-containing protein [Bacteroidota bacterium]
MKWYIAKIVYQIVCGTGNHTPQFDEQLRIINAEDDIQAFNKARLLGEREDDRFLNNKNKPVEWRFLDVASLHLIDFEDGHEVGSRIFEEDSAKDYLLFLRAKSKRLHDDCIEKTFSL